MQRTQVASSNILSVGYDSGTMTLEVEFRNGNVYQYFDVPQGAYEELMTASSIGGFINTVVKQNYRYARA